MPLRHTAILTISILVLGCGGTREFDAAQVIEREESLALVDLWPGFEPLNMPVAVFDGEKTVLARHPSVPEGFQPLPGHDGMYYHEGRHPAVVAQTVAEIGGVRSAVMPMDSTVKLDPHNTAESLAAVLVHESFHIFQGETHPYWCANEALTFTYPVEDTTALVLRRLETEALAKAIHAGSEGETRAWALGALKCRKERFLRLGGALAGYERDMELVEGTAHYVEQLSLGDAGRKPLDEFKFAVDKFRYRCYKTGQAICLLLDRFAPGWKDTLETADKIHLDPLLAKALEESKEEPREFSGQHVADVTLEAAKEIGIHLAKLKKMREEFLSAAGDQVEIRVDNPQNMFWSVSFDPMNLQRLSATEVLHARWLKLSGSGGVVEIMNHGALTKGMGPHPILDGVKGVTITGLQGVEIDTQTDAIEFDSDVLKFSFGNAKTTQEDGKTLIAL